MRTPAAGRKAGSVSKVVKSAWAPIELMTSLLPTAIRIACCFLPYQGEERLHPLLPSRMYPSKCS